VFEDTICAYNWEIYWETEEERTPLFCEDVLLEKGGRGREGLVDDNKRGADND
jgi:hypothetical protein